MDLQKISITGNLTEDARVQNPGEKGFTVFSVACNPSKDVAEFFSVAMSGTGLTEYLKKGKKVYVEGQLSITSKVNDRGESIVFKNINRSTVILM